MSRIQKSRPTKYLFAFALALLGVVVTAPQARAATPLPAEQTLAFELFNMERDARPLPAETEALLRKVLADGLAAGGATAPASQQEFIAFAERVAVSLAKHNFIQPLAKDDWPNSLGQVLTPLPADHPRASANANLSNNAARRPYLDMTKPLHFVDCDMGALILMSVAQMAGFELNLVEVPDHNFVRWHGLAGQIANWDWTYWASHPDALYVAQRGISTAQLRRKAFLQSQTATESRGYFIGVMAIPVQDPAKKLALRRLAIESAAKNPTTANNAAWAFATVPTGVTPEERRDAIVYGLSAWASQPGDLNFIDTVACSFGAAGNWNLAVALENHAAAIDPAYSANLARLRQKQLCTD